MNGYTVQENGHCAQGCHAGMQQLARQQRPLAVRRIAGWLGSFLLSFITILFLLDKLWPGMNSAAEQAALALLALGATGSVMIAARKCSQLWGGHSD